MGRDVLINAAAEARAERFKQGMRELAAGVCVVATSEAGRRYGLTVTAVCSLSADPPSLLVCVNRTTEAHDPILRTGRLSVNVLTADQIDIAQRFAGANGCNGEARFAAGNWEETETGVPLLGSCLAAFACSVFERGHQRTHTILQCFVDEVRVNNGSPPLLYAGRHYASLQVIS
jgi:flavin reductase